MPDFSRLAILFGSLLGIAFTGVVIIIIVRRYYLGGATSQTPLPFTLQDLRDMYSRGQITTIEYETMRAAMIGEHTAQKDVPPTRNVRDIPPDDAIQP